MPKPQVRWMKQGVEIKQSQEYQIEEMEDGTSILIIPEVYKDDTGEIVFEAYNPLGVTSTIAALSVQSELSLLDIKITAQNISEIILKYAMIAVTGLPKLWTRKNK